MKGLNNLGAILDAAKRAKPQPPPVREQPRQPYLLNIGLDFGTAFTKCIVRDEGKKVAYPVAFEMNGAPTYLLPSEILTDGQNIYTPFGAVANGKLQAIPYLKMALAAAADGTHKDDWLRAARTSFDAAGTNSEVVVLESLVVLYLSSVLSEVFKFIQVQWPGFGQNPKDQVFVNMALPVAHAQKTSVERIFSSALKKSWDMASAAAHKEIPINGWGEKIASLTPSAKAENACYLYPEVSANIQPFTRSRASQEGMYLFADVGAGTVDVSIFIWFPSWENSKPVSYLYAEVLPLGSSQIEIQAFRQLEERLKNQIRSVKEGQTRHKTISLDLVEEMAEALDSIGRSLRDEVGVCVAKAKQKLRRQSRQFKRIQILYGGGGVCKHPYESGIVSSFAPWNLTPDAHSLPQPPDLFWPRGVDGASLFRRFTVAYGLSFLRATLDEHRFPEEIAPLPEDVNTTLAPVERFVSKEQI